MNACGVFLSLMYVCPGGCHLPSGVAPYTLDGTLFGKTPQSIRERTPSGVLAEFQANSKVQ